MLVHFDFYLKKGTLMKPIHLIAAISLGLSGFAFAADGHNHGHQHKPLHGGIVTEVKDMDYELVTKPEVIQLYLRDHGKPVDVTNVSAKLTILIGTEKQEIELKSAGQWLEAKGNFKVSGGKAVALVSFKGKSPVSVRFMLK